MLSPAARHKQITIARLADEQKAAQKQAVARAQAVSTQTMSTTAPPFAGDDSEASRPTESPAARHRQEMLARLAVEGGSAAADAPERASTGAEATEYELLLAALGEDMARLKSIQSTEGKIAAKREMIEAYSPHIDASLAAAAETGQAVQDELLVTIMLWRLDIGDFDRGLDIAEHVLRFGLRLPERFQRTPGTLIAEEIAEAALVAAGQDRDFDLAVLQRTDQLTSHADMPDIVRAKLHKAIGFQFVRTAERADKNSESAPAGAAHAARVAAQESLRRAIELEPKIGVKKEIERLTAWLNKNIPAPAPSSSEDDGGDQEQE